MGPPCSLYQEVIPITHMQATALEFGECLFKEDIEQKKKVLHSLKAPVCDLMNAAQVALTDINKARKQIEDTTAKASAAAAKAAPKPTGAAQAAKRNRASAPAAAQNGVLTEAVTPYVHHTSCSRFQLGGSEGHELG